MKEPGRYDITPKRKPVFRILPTAGKQGMTIEQPFTAPFEEETASPAEEAPATEAADLSAPPAAPDAYEQHEPETIGHQPRAHDPEEGSGQEFFTAQEQPDGASYSDAAGAEYSASGTTDEYGAALAEYQDPADTGYYLEPGTAEYDAYYAAAATGFDESTLTEDTQSIPQGYDAGTVAEYAPYSYTPELEVDPAGPLSAFHQTEAPAAESAASLTSWDQTPAPEPGRLTLPGAFSQSGASVLKPSPGPRPPAPAPAPFQPRTAPTPDPNAWKGFPLWSLVLASLVFLALGAAGGYFFSKPIGDVPAPVATIAVASRDPAATPPLVEATSLKSADQEAVDAAFAANKAGNFDGAIKMFSDLQARHPEWVSMGIEIGRSQLYQHDLTTAGATLKDALSKGRAPSDAQFLLGLLFMTNSAFPDAEASFAKAVSLDPARPDFYYFWGELLRREGKPLEAASKFRSALLRNQYETAEGLYRLKAWLSDIQADQEKTNGASAEIDAGLAQPRPPMEALLAGAARSIKAGQISEAASLIRRARQLVEPTVFFVVTQDPSFVQESWRPELADLFKPDPALAAAAAPDAAVPASTPDRPARGK